MPTATALDGGQLARPAPSLTHTLTASALTAVSAAVQEKTALLTQHLAALSTLAASPPPPPDEPELFHRYETLRTQLRTLSAAVAVCELPASDEGLVRELGAFLAQPSVGAAPSRESMLRAVNDVAASGDFGAGGEDEALRAALRAAPRVAAAPPPAPAPRRTAALSYEQLGYERPPPAPPDVPWNLPTNKKPVWLRDERDDHQEARLAVRPEHGESTRRHGALRPVRSLPAGVRQRQTPRRTSGDAAASPSRPSPPPRATVTVPLLQPATQAFAFSERAAGLRAPPKALRGPPRGSVGPPPPLSPPKPLSPPRISVVRTPTSAGGSGAGSFRLAATPPDLAPVERWGLGTPEDAQVSVPSVSVSRKDSRDREP